MAFFVVSCPHEKTSKEINTYPMMFFIVVYIYLRLLLPFFFALFPGYMNLGLLSWKKIIQCRVSGCVQAKQVSAKTRQVAAKIRTLMADPDNNDSFMKRRFI
jgi:hypothetical protein